MPPVSQPRRALVIGLPVAGCALALGRPGAALASRAEADGAAARLTGGVRPQAGKVSLKLPEIADNGATVPFTVSVDHPMAPGNYVREVHILATDNPAPQVASFHFTPTGKAEVSGRLRLARSQEVRAIALLSDGSAWEARREVKVTVGGCGG
ncbi:thiosulfate oxidation carrier protein SoxY [Magnetospirillum sp. ME-1]|uniref:thiosulfate oxidation carrier protein SoxY n=1 Tax=Magnetospirillum sp. ME-1 TaxID=1639348 RepID=UPI000A17AEA9|nr:thiosulfate oxidation carrier protein SoxY [Magnetospirillum sp. ME-1]ARJ64842.1 thiosulfate oxidation carrier protein SoxY [Magnetospirillum sp. ME-1]